MRLKKEIVTGKKADLISRLLPLLTDHEIDELPHIYVLTDSSLALIEKHAILIRAHADPDLTVEAVIRAKEQAPLGLDFEAIKTSIHKTNISIHLEDGDYGLVRNQYLYLYRQFKKTDPDIALLYILLVIILDLSGLDNNYNRKRSRK